MQPISTFRPAVCPEDPTDALPGSEEKIRIMTERAARRLQLFHPLDGPACRAAAPQAQEPVWDAEDDLLLELAAEAEPSLV